MKKYGLVGKNLSYSYSKTIHDYLIDYYHLNAVYEMIQVNSFDSELLKKYNGLNITIPYKETVIPYLNQLDSPIEACNTILNDSGEYLGYNTDIIGFAYLVDKLALPKIEKIVVLGSGASSLMVKEYFKDKEVIIISRRDPLFNYEHLETINADLLVNTTPVGMSEYNSPIKSDLLVNFLGVIDLNYNPINSKLSLDCKKNDIKFINGLLMLIKQACKSFELWHNISINDEIIKQIEFRIYQKHYNKFALIGMPLAGKSTIIRRYNGFDLDDEIEINSCTSISNLIEEGSFRDQEHKTLASLVNNDVSLIALGGGAILKHENLELLKDYLIIYYQVELSDLLSRYKPNKRPLLKSEDDLIQAYYKRLPLYLKYANVVLDKNSIIELIENQV